MRRWLHERLFLFAVWAYEKGGESLMDERTLKIFAATYVTLIMTGRRTLNDVPMNLVAYVKADLGITE